MKQIYTQLSTTLTSKRTSLKAGLSSIIVLLLFLSAQHAEASCSVQLPSISSSNACASISFAPYSTNSYEVEYMWAENVNGWIYARTDWSTSTDLSYCPSSSGNYRICARVVGCTYDIYESEDTYVDTDICAGINDLLPYIQENEGDFEQTDFIKVCSGTPIVLDMEGTNGSNWSFTYTRPDGTELAGGTDGVESDQISFTAIDEDVTEGIWEVNYTSPEGCTGSESFTVRVIPVPTATSTKTDETCAGDPGSITFHFADQARSKIEFSIDGGTTWPSEYKVSDAIGSFTIDELSAGTYDLMVRWGNDDCPVDLADQTIIEATVASCTASIGDLVWKDTNQNGIKEEDEIGIAGIEVKLWLDNEGDGVVDTELESTSTDGQGFYEFTALSADQYYIIQVVLDDTQNCEFTAAGQGDGTNDSAVIDTENGYTAAYFLQAGDTKTNADAGLIFNLAAVLPVDLVYFDASVINDGVKLQWLTATEENNEYFEVLRSANGRDWDVIEVVEGQGTTAQETRYQIIDKHALSGIAYYRLKQIDFDGTFSYSDIQSVKVENTTILQTNVFPTVATELVTLETNTTVESENIQIFNQSGRPISLTIAEKTANRISFTVNQLPQGMYFISIRQNNEVSTRRFFVGK